MVCRHAPGDLNCTTRYPQYNYHEPVKEVKIEVNAPDPFDWEILESQEVGKHLVLKVKYPNCKKCAFEGTKILVYLNTAPITALKWKKIDPHFRNGPFKTNEAPSPAARFPATNEGWQDAIEYCKGKK